MARKMVCEWGMSDQLGPLTFGKNEEHIFLGREVARAKDYSEETALPIDSEIKRIVVECATRARQILEENIEKLHALARALLERESLDSEEIARILRAQPFTEATRSGLIPTLAGAVWRVDCRAADAEQVSDGRAPALPVAVMGVLNVSPESFHAGSVYRERGGAGARGARHGRGGGGDRRRRGAVDGALPRDRDRRGRRGRRLVRGVETLAAKLPVPVSADTRRPGPARAALEAGARVINDVSRAARSGARAAGRARTGGELSPDGRARGAAARRRRPPTRAVGRIAPTPWRWSDRCRLERARRGRHPGPSAIVARSGHRLLSRGGGALARLGCARCWRGWRELRRSGGRSCVGVSRKSFLGAITGRAATARPAGGLAGGDRDRRGQRAAADPDPRRGGDASTPCAWPSASGERGRRCVTCSSALPLARRARHPARRARSIYRRARRCSAGPGPCRCHRPRGACWRRRWWRGRSSSPALTWLLDHFWSFWVDRPRSCCSSRSCAARWPGSGRGRSLQAPARRRRAERAQVVDEIVQRRESLAGRRIGALIVIERATGLRQYAELGVPLDALVSADLLESVFLPILAAARRRRLRAGRADRRPPAASCRCRATRRVGARARHAPSRRPRHHRGDRRGGRRRVRGDRRACRWPSTGGSKASTTPRRSGGDFDRSARRRGRAPEAPAHAALSGRRAAVAPARPGGPARACDAARPRRRLAAEVLSLALAVGALALRGQRRAGEIVLRGARSSTWGCAGISSSGRPRDEPSTSQVARRALGGERQSSPATVRVRVDLRHAARGGESRAMYSPDAVQAPPGVRVTPGRPGMGHACAVSRPSTRSVRVVPRILRAPGPRLRRRWAVWWSSRSTVVRSRGLALQSNRGQRRDAARRRLGAPRER